MEIGAEACRGRESAQGRLVCDDDDDVKGVVVASVCLQMVGLNSVVPSCG